MEDKIVKYFVGSALGFIAVSFLLFLIMSFFPACNIINLNLQNLNVRFNWYMITFTLASCWIIIGIGTLASYVLNEEKEVLFDE